MDLKTGDTRLIIDACLKEGLLRNQCAYVLATAYHETAHTMKPVTELGGPKYLKSKPYYPFVGRGYVQLTWEVNYQKASDKLGVNFVKDPTLLLDPQYAAQILVIGMKEGWFTSKKLSTYITLSKSDYKGARRIINGTDRANDIADYAQQYDALLLIDGYGVVQPSIIPDKPSVVVITPHDDRPPTITVTPAPPEPVLVPAPAKNNRNSFIVLIIMAVSALLAWLGVH